MTPRDRILASLARESRISRTRKRNRLVRVKKNATTHRQEQSWEMTVARLEPRTPMPRVNISSGSSAILISTPTRIDPMAIRE